MSDEIIERSFPVTAKASLRLSNIRGTVNIMPGDEHLIVVTAVKHSNGACSKDTHIEMNQEADERVVIRTSYPSDALMRLLISGKPCKVDYEVRVPKACRLHVSGVSNTARVQGITGEIELKTVSGSLTLEEVSGTIEISSVSGDVFAQGLAGPSLQISTVSGDMDLKQGDFPRIEGKTVSGDLRIATTLGEGPYRFNSVSGDVELIVPNDTGCSIKVNGISGSLNSALPLTSQQHRNGVHLAEVQGGGVSVKLETVSGDLLLKTAADEEIRSHAWSPTRSSHEEILDRIEHGEMSVEEGLQALRS